jgi:hypothetical protein
MEGPRSAEAEVAKKREHNQKETARRHSVYVVAPVLV